MVGWYVGDVLTKGQKRRHALTRIEAAESLGISLSAFEDYVQPNIRLVRCGRRVLVPEAELERWLKDNARRAF